MKNLRLLLFSLLMLSGVNLYSNEITENDSLYYTYTEYELPVLSVLDDIVYEIFDSIIATTDACESGHSLEKPSYSVTVKKDKYSSGYNKKENTDYIHIETYEEWETIRIAESLKHYKGVLYYKNSLFVVGGSLFEKYFKITDEKRKYTVKRRNNIPRPEDNGVIYEVEVLSEPAFIWEYECYNNGKIELVGRYCHCDNIPTIKTDK